MGYEKANYGDVESKGGLRFLRGALDCEQQGVSVVDVADGFDGKAHDHADEDHEEVYLLLDGAGELTVEGETVSLEPGDAVRVDPEETRELSLRGDSLLVVSGAP